MQKASGYSKSGEFESHPFQFPWARAYSTLETTALDYAKFLVALIKGSGLLPKTFHEMMSPQVHVNENCFQCVDSEPGQVSPEISWGLGIGLEIVGGKQRFWHWGDNRGRFQSFMMGSVKDKDAIVIFTNSGRGLSIVPQIVAELFGDEHPEFEWLQIRHSVNH
jgi:CubicO group peptidase (beta-lactamase class C family)